MIRDNEIKRIHGWVLNGGDGSVFSIEKRAKRLLKSVQTLAQDPGQESNVQFQAMKDVLSILEQRYGAEIFA